MNIVDFQKVISLLENPPEEGQIRDILDTYAGPRDFARYGSYFDFIECSQDMLELAQMLEFVKGSHSLLDIGSRYGETLRRMSEVLAPRSTVVAVDWPLVDGLDPIFNPRASLEAKAEEILRMGHRVHVGFGDSHASNIIEHVRGLGPFDFGFIDGDHSYEGVKADWENYSPMCAVMGFHDIINNHGCLKFWKEISAKYRTTELINYAGRRMLGIGIVFVDALRKAA